MSEFICPACGLKLRSMESELSCESGLHNFRIVSGIPWLVRHETDADHDELDHDRRGFAHDASKDAQAAFFDRDVAAEFETTRPHQTPRFYQFLLEQKLRRALDLSGSRPAASTALVVCGGSGMDAEFLSRAGFHVTSTDISAGAAERTMERARRFGVSIETVVADVEQLPFPDRSFDLVLVHDGLHHLDDPFVGLSEMARVSRQWLSITEPARAAATRLAVRAGLALEREEAGNRVARLSPREVVDHLSQAGFAATKVERYAMYYKHTPGRLMAALSGKRTFPVATAIWRAGNVLLGPLGNKVVIIAERRPKSG